MTVHAEIPILILMASTTVFVCCLLYWPEQGFLARLTASIYLTAATMAGGAALRWFFGG